MSIKVKGPTGNWYKSSKDLEGVLLDISGVLLDSTDNGDLPIEGSVEAVNRLKNSGLPVRFCTNESQLTKEGIVEKLTKLGFYAEPNEVFSPVPAVAKILEERKLRPYLLVHKDVQEEFSVFDQSDPTCVVIGDAVDEFSYDNLNKAFQVLLKMKNPQLFSMGKGKYYKHGDGLQLDVGPFMKALEYACDVDAEVVGKPSKVFFETAVKDIGAKAEKILMIGDDIVNDVDGSKACGLKGVQVRTGKYRPSDEPHPVVVPDGYVDNLAQAVDLILQHKT